MTTIRVALAQLNPVVGALHANSDRIIATVRSVGGDADVVVFGEFAVCGYPPEDLVLKQRFVDDCEAEVQHIAESTGSCAAVVGTPERGSDGRLYNSAVLCREGAVQHRYRKRELPNYQVFDEQRWFSAGPVDQPLWSMGTIPVGVSICEDIWVDDGPVMVQARAGARLLVNVNGSPYHGAKAVERETMLRERAVATGIPIVYVNQVGGQDELVFDGGSLVVGGDGQLLARFPRFVEHVEVVEVDLDGASRPPERIEPSTIPTRNSGRRWYWVPATTAARTGSPT
ncbi:MAG: nitrilase-related carbon-nitrogen hydrolase [Microthrixaceae bacterium]